MPRESAKLTLNMDDAESKRRLMAQIGRLRGFYRVSVEPAGNKRSNAANRYHFGVLVAAFVEFWNAQEPCKISPEDAHTTIKRHVLGVDSIVLPSGEVVEVPKPTHTMTSEEFFDFVERARAWLSQSCGIETQDPDREYRNERIGAKIDVSKLRRPIDPAPEF